MINEKYTFLPWLRRGLSSQIPQKENASVGSQTLMRATLDAKVYLNNDGGPYVSKSFQLFGPGDIARLHGSTVLRTEPEPNTSNFEANYLPAIEFYDEDLPWRYTPSIPADATPNRLTPWIALIVLKNDEEFEIDTQSPGKPKIILKAPALGANFNKVFPSHEQLWAWAHVHVYKGYTESETTDLPVIQSELSDQTLSVSRLICPRRLEAGIKYTCFVIPTFESGRKTGLGEDASAIKSLQKAWDTQIPPMADFHMPFYYSWSFTTDDGGDFETLASKIEPYSVPTENSGRDMFIANPGLGMPDDAILPIHGEHLEILKMGGALTPPLAETVPIHEVTFNVGQTSVRPYNDYCDHIQQLIELNDQALAPDSHLPFGEWEDPGVLPPLYGQWHAQTNSVESPAPDWVKTLNLDPRNRIAAAIGTQIVKENQEQFMQECWEQVEDVLNANQRIRQAELGARVSQAMFEKHILHPKEDVADPAVESRMLRMTSKFHHTVTAPGTAHTVKKYLQNSRVPDGVLDPTFRKLANPIRKRNRIFNQAMDNTYNTFTTNLVSRLNAGTTRAHEQYPLYKKVGLPGDAIPLETLKEASAKVEAAIGGIQSNNNIPTDPTSAANNVHSFTHQVNQVKNVTMGNQETLRTPATPTATHSLGVQLSPIRTITEKIKTNIEVWDHATQGFIPLPSLAPVMAYPQLDIPVYELLKTISPDYIIPNLHQLPENSATLMKVNTPFIEALFAGLNHEMGRELLWREYPTDQRGSYLRMFWDKSDDPSFDPETPEYDIDLEIPDWTNELGENMDNDSAYLVLVVRGELLQKFPDTLIYAVEGQFDPEHTFPANPSQSDIENAPRKIVPDGDKKFPVFKAHLGKDVTLIGFDLDVNIALGKQQISGDEESATWGYTTSDAGYFFALQERPGQLRFGLDVTDAPAPLEAQWKDLNWGHFPNTPVLNTNNSPTATIVNNTFNLVWGSNSADMASILFQKPILFLVHATDMID